jgi:outer membrane protein OmpA-like peptidoglycan-associated protein
LPSLESEWTHVRHSLDDGSPAGRGEDAQDDSQMPVKKAWVWCCYFGVMPLEGKGSPTVDISRASLDVTWRPIFSVMGVVVMLLSVVGLTWLFTGTRLAGTSTTLISHDPTLRSTRNRGDGPTVELPEGSVGNDRHVSAAADVFKLAPPSSLPALSSQRPAILMEANRPKMGETIHVSHVGKQLRSFLEQDHAKEAVFNLTRISFIPTKATLTTEAHEELKQIAQILRTFPNAYVVVGVSSEEGRTKALKTRISAQRERTIRTELVRLGVARSAVILPTRSVSSRFQDKSRQVSGYGSHVWLIVKKTRLSTRDLSTR